MNWTFRLLGALTLLLSFFVFYIIYLKTGIARWVNKKPVTLTIALAFILLLFLASIARTINFDSKYDSIYQGFVFGLVIGIVPHINKKQKS